jgi:glycosyltransferase involved in cell wall biosynthesis
MADDIRISVALVTRNRPDSLRRCLASLRAQSVQPFEVLVSDDSDDSFVEKTMAAADESGCRRQAGPRRGLYANRNAAALACAGTHIRTMDDDHTFPPGHFAACLAAVRGDPAAFWSTGEVGYIDGEFYGRTERALQLTPAGVGSPPPDPDDNWAVADGSTIYPRAVFDRGLRMAEDFAYGAAYLEFGIFLYRNGWRGRCVPGAVVEHFAGHEILERRDAESCLWAGLCFNLHFRPSLFRVLRCVAAYTRPCAPGRVAWRAVPALWRAAGRRWGGIAP